MQPHPHAIVRVKVPIVNGIPVDGDKIMCRCGDGFTDFESHAEHVNPTTEPYIFNWQDAEEGDFFKWLIPTLVSRISPELFSQLHDITGSWTDVHLGVSVNGVDVPPVWFMRGVENNLHAIARQEAERIVNQAGMPRLRETLVAAELAAQEFILSKLDAAGIKIPEELL